jgi:hypothetical protein
VGQVLRTHPPAQLVKAYVYLDGGAPRPPSDILFRLGRFLVVGGAGTAGPGVVVERRTVALDPRLVDSGGAHPAVDRGAPRSRRRLTPLAIAGWSLVSAGLATTLVGGVLVGIDGHTIVGSDREADRYQTDTAGYATLGTGLGVAVIGAVLLVVDAVRAKRQRASRSASPEDASRASPTRGARVTVTPLVAPRAGGGFFGLSGRF